MSLVIQGQIIEIISIPLIVPELAYLHTLVLELFYISGNTTYMVWELIQLIGTPNST